MIAIFLAVLPYCTPQTNNDILAKCLDYFVVCMENDLNKEEMCSESMPFYLEGK
jgi:hypothetical protein